MPPPSPPYVELHCHSGYSFLDGASHLDELLLRAAEHGYPALALTDHDGLYGSMEFARMAKEIGIRPLTGAEVTVSGCFPEWEADGEGPAPLPAATWRPSPPGAPSSTSDDRPPLLHHMTLLVESATGYANLCRLLTEAHMEAPERGAPRLPLPSLLARSEGLILLTGCRRSPLRTALADARATGETFLGRLADAFGPDRLFVELQDHRVRGDRERNGALARLADDRGVPVVATGNVHYHERARHRLQDTLVAIRHRTTLDASHALRRPNSEFHLHSPGEMARRFASRPDAIANTLRIAERCAAFDLTEGTGYTFPDFQGSGNGTSAIRTLAEVCRARLDERYPASSPRRAEAERRLDEELGLVERHGLAGFFLVYRDILELAREMAARVRANAPRARLALPPGRGRGSSVSSIICYLIGLSHIDPVENELFLGRFLNEAMGSVPDIDLDFSREIRDELILAVYERYGSEHAGLVCTFPTYRLRSAVREVGRALELPSGEIEKLARLSEHHSARGLRDEMLRLEGFRDRIADPSESAADVPSGERAHWELLVELCHEIAGLPRHVSQHVGGMVISSRPLCEVVPLERGAMEGRVLCQWDKDSCDDAGFIKIDFLALGMLSLVEDAVELVAGREDDAPDLSRIDFEDEAVFDRIADGDTVGIFQVESRAQIQMLRRVRPRNLKELAIQVAIVRPGPIVGGAVNPYVRRRELMREDPDFRVPYDHPLLEDALAETLGVIIFQDQVLQVCRDLAGFTAGQADELRRTISRKRSRRALVRHWDDFREGARERGVDEETARGIFRQVAAFSQFGFPKSHAAAFGLLAYQSAWLRHHHPTEYYVAIFNNQPMGFYALDALARDARRNGVEVRLPDVNRSGARCTPEGDDLRVGLGFVRGWSEETAERVVAERERGGPFRSLPDFLRRTPSTLRRPAIENLVWVGGFDSLGVGRRTLLWQVGLCLGPESDGGRSGGRGDDPQLGLGLGSPYEGRSFPDVDAQDRLLAEYGMLRFAAENHPLGLLRDALPPDTVTVGRLRELPQRSTVRVAGVVVARQRPQTAKGYVFILIEDEDGPLNLILKPEIYDRDRAAARMEPLVTARGRLQRDGATLNVIVEKLEPLRLRDAPPPESDAATPRDPIAGVRPSRADARPDTSGKAPEIGGAPSGRERDPFRFLTALRQGPPGSKSWG